MEIENVLQQHYMFAALAHHGQGREEEKILTIGNIAGQSATGEKILRA